MKRYKIRRFQNGTSKKGKPFFNYSLTVPAYIAERLPKGMEFVVELDERGILFRPAESAVERPKKLPKWARNGSPNPVDSTDKVGS